MALPSKIPAITNHEFIKMMHRDLDLVAIYKQNDTNEQHLLEFPFINNPANNNIANNMVLVANAIRKLCNNKINVPNYSLTNAEIDLDGHQSNVCGLGSKIIDGKIEDSNLRLLSFIATSFLDKSTQYTQESITEKIIGIINLTDEAIMDIATKTELGNLDEKKLLGNQMIRLKYFIAKENGLVPNYLTKHSSFESIANFIVKTYTYFAFDQSEINPKTLSATFNPQSVNNPLHGVEHGIRTRISMVIFNDFINKWSFGFLPANSDQELQKMLDISGPFHDTGRDCDTGLDTKETEKRSGDLCYNFLTKLKFDEDKAELIRQVIINKDHPDGLKAFVMAKNNPNKFNPEIAESCRILLHDADCIEINRVTEGFKREELIIYKKILDEITKVGAKLSDIRKKDQEKLTPTETKEKNETEDYLARLKLALKELDEIIGNYKTLLERMGDGKTSNPELKRPFSNSNDPYNDIYEIFNNYSYENRKIFRNFLENEFVAVDTFKLELGMDTRLLGTYSSQKTDDLLIPGSSKETSEIPYHETLFDNADQRKKYYGNLNKPLKRNWQLCCATKCPKVVKKEDFKEDTFYLFLGDKKIYYRGPRTGNLTIISIDADNLEVKFHDQETQQCIVLLTSLLEHFLDTTSDDALQKKIITCIENIIQKKPDPHFPIDNTKFEISKRPTLLVKGITKYSYQVYRSLGHIPPYAVLIKEDPPMNSLQDEMHVDRSRKDSGRTSFSNDVKSAEEYTLFNGHVYLIITPPGTIRKKADITAVNLGSKFEITLSGGCDQQDIIAHRKCCGSFLGPIFIRKATIRKYGQKLANEFCRFVLNDDEAFYLLDGYKSDANSAEITAFINKITALNNIEKSTYKDIEANQDLRSFLINFYVDIETLARSVAKENEHILRISIYLALATSHRTCFYQLLNTIDIAKRLEFLKNKIGLENLKNFILTTDHFVILINSLPQEKWREFLTDGLALSLVERSFNLKIFLERFDINSFASFKEKFGLGFAKAAASLSYSNLQALMSRFNIPPNQQLQFIVAELGLDFFKSLIIQEKALESFWRIVPKGRQVELFEKLSINFIIECIQNKFKLEAPLFVSAETRVLTLMAELYALPCDHNETRNHAIEAVEQHLSKLNSFAEIEKLLTLFLENDSLYTSIYQYGISFLMTYIVNGAVKIKLDELTQFYDSCIQNPQAALSEHKTLQFAELSGFRNSKVIKLIETSFDAKSSLEVIKYYDGILENRGEVLLSDEFLMTRFYGVNNFSIMDSNINKYFIHRTILHASVLVSPKNWSKTFYEFCLSLSSFMVKNRAQFLFEIGYLARCLYVYEKLHAVLTLIDPNHTYLPNNAPVFPFNFDGLVEEDIEKIPRLRFFIFMNTYLNINKGNIQEPLLKKIHGLPLRGCTASCEIIPQLPENVQAESWVNLFLSLEESDQIAGCQKILECVHFNKNLDVFISSIWKYIKEPNREEFIEKIIPTIEKIYPWRYMENRAPLMAGLFLLFQKESWQIKLMQLIPKIETLRPTEFWKSFSECIEKQAPQDYLKNMASIIFNILTGPVEQDSVSSSILIFSNISSSQVVYLATANKINNEQDLDRLIKITLALDSHCNRYNSNTNTWTDLFTLVKWELKTITFVKCLRNLDLKDWVHFLDVAFANDAGFYGIACHEKQRQHIESLPLDLLISLTALVISQYSNYPTRPNFLENCYNSLSLKSKANAESYFDQISCLLLNDELRFYPPQIETIVYNCLGYFNNKELQLSIIKKLWQATILNPTNVEYCIVGLSKTYRSDLANVVREACQKFMTEPKVFPTSQTETITGASSATSAVKVSSSSSSSSSVVAPLITGTLTAPCTMFSAQSTNSPNNDATRPLISSKTAHRDCCCYCQ